ncbi:MAG: hypothetical protein JSW28_04700 [Thermoplasmata archaeon]|nr:MAG: hypothetical protein JSW28_08565 [Thermoplasmata archaeon]UCF08989.1 MAG: hypothetical protein JSW28_04700 [Thermoplasmata archaeon]
MKKTNNKGIPSGFGYLIGTGMAIAAFIILGLILKNIPLGAAWFVSGYAVGFTIEGDNQRPFSKRQKRMALSSVISGGISLVLSLLLFNVVFF